MPHSIELRNFRNLRKDSEDKNQRNTSPDNAQDWPKLRNETELKTWILLELPWQASKRYFLCCDKKIWLFFYPDLGSDVQSICTFTCLMTAHSVWWYKFTNKVSEAPNLKTFCLFIEQWDSYIQLGAFWLFSQVPISGMCTTCLLHVYYNCLFFPTPLTSFLKDAKGSASQTEGSGRVEELTGWAVGRV